MRKTAIVLMILIFAVPAYAQTVGDADKPCPFSESGKKPCPMMQDMKGQGMMQGERQMRQPGPMAGQMTGHGMMMDDMMQMMNDMLNMQEKIITGVKPGERKMMLEKIADMRGRIKQKMSMHRCMMCPCPNPMMGEEQKEAAPPQEETAPETQHKH